MIRTTLQNVCLSLVWTLFLLVGKAQSPLPWCDRVTMLLKTVEAHHYSPRAVDDAYSELVFDAFLESLDPDGLILNTKDVERLAEYKTAIDDQVLDGQCDFLDLATRLYTQKLNATDSLLETLSGQPFDPSSPDSIVFPATATYVPEAELNRKWSQWIRYQSLYAYAGRPDSLREASSAKADFNELQKRWIENERCWVQSRVNHPGGISELVGSRFLEALAASFDPHTNYFTPAEENSLETMLSSNTRSFGIELCPSRSGALEVCEVIPGSPAWRSNALNVGDVILGVTPAGGTKQSFECLPVREAVHFLNDEKLEEAVFHVRKKSGSEAHVPLFKSEVTVQDNVVQSFILSGDQKIGYIYLPAFYTELDNYFQAANGCANDVAKELIQLDREGIKGLVLDLRDNGGGSLLEAMRMVGIFINYGAVGIKDVRGDDPETLKDPARGTIFNAPLVILINGYSASASEFLAASLQDQNRAIVVGSTSFGKFTAQQILPLDAYRNQFNADCPEGYIKLTVGKLFRVDGSSIQKTGVTPDVALPGLYDNLDLGERALPAALEPTTIDKKTYYFPLAAPPRNELKASSQERIKQNPDFADIKSQSKQLAEDEPVAIPLDLKGFLAYYERLPDAPVDDDSKELTDEGLTGSNPGYVNARGERSALDQEINENTRNEIQTDPYVLESYRIINDWIQLNHN